MKIPLAEKTVLKNDSKHRNILANVKSEQKKRSENLCDFSEQTENNYCQGKKIFLVVFSALATATMILAGEGTVLADDNQFLFLGWFLLFFFVAVSALKDWYFTFKNAQAEKNQVKEEQFETVKRHKKHFCLADFFVFAVFLGMIVSYLLMILGEYGNPRRGLNMIFMFSALIGVYYMLRFVFNTPKIIFPFLILIIAVSFSEAVYSLYTVQIRDPQMRTEYKKNPEKMLQENGIDAPKGSAARTLLENRLLSSSEPLGTFALTNTLAGTLLLGSILLLGLAIIRRQNDWLFACSEVKNRRLVRPAKGEKNQFAIRITGEILFFVILLGIVSYILISTKSRSGILAFLFGLFGLFLCFGYIYFRNKYYCFNQNINQYKEQKQNINKQKNEPISELEQDSNINQCFDKNEDKKQFDLFVSVEKNSNTDKKAIRWRIGAGIILTIILVLGTVISVWDKEVWTEAGKSLGYRLQYWESSCRMIQNYPWAGVGPGNFQSVYSRFKLPTASETIADPHQFLFEIAAVFGIPTFIFFLLFLFYFVVKFPWSLYFSRNLMQFQNEQGKMSDSLRNLSKPEVSEQNGKEKTSDFLPSGENRKDFSDFQRMSANEKSIKDNENAVDAARYFSLFIIGGLLGVFLAFGVSLTCTAGIDVVFLGVALAVIGSFWLFVRFSSWKSLFFNKTEDHKFLSWRYLFLGLILVAWCALMIHWLASGGFSFSSSAFIFWGLSAILVNEINFFQSFISTNFSWKKMSETGFLLNGQAQNQNQAQNPAQKQDQGQKQNCIQKSGEKISKNQFGVPVNELISVLLTGILLILFIRISLNPIMFSKVLWANWANSSLKNDLTLDSLSLYTDFVQENDQIERSSLGISDDKNWSDKNLTDKIFSGQISEAQNLNDKNRKRQNRNVQNLTRFELDQKLQKTEQAFLQLTEIQRADPFSGKVSESLQEMFLIRIVLSADRLFQVEKQISLENIQAELQQLTKEYAENLSIWEQLEPSKASQFFNFAQQELKTAQYLKGLAVQVKTSETSKTEWFKTETSQNEAKDADLLDREKTEYEKILSTLILYLEQMSEKHFLQAIERFPNSIDFHCSAALFYIQAFRESFVKNTLAPDMSEEDRKALQRAVPLAQKALDLDAVCPHSELKLTTEFRHQLERIVQTLKKGS